MESNIVTINNAYINKYILSERYLVLKENININNENEEK